VRLRGILVREAARFTDPWCLAAAYFLLLGGLMAGIFVPELRLLGIVLGAAVVADLVRHLHQRHDAVDLAAAAALLLFAVGNLASTDARYSLEVLLFGVALLALFVRLRRRFAEPAARDRLLTVAGRVAIGVAVGVALLWIWESVGWWLEGGPGLPPVGLDYSDDWFRNLNLLPVYLALSWPAVAHCLTRRAERWLGFAALGAMLVVTALSAARAAWIGIAAGAVAFGLLQLARHRGGWRLRGRAVRWLVVAGTALVAVAVATGILPALLDGVTDLATLRVRTDIWDAALAGWRENPLAGSGLGTITGELLRGGLAAEGRAPAPHAHSVPVQLLAEAGLLGVLAAVLGLSAVAWRAVKHRGSDLAPDATIRFAAVAAIVAYAVDGLADNHSAIAAVDVLALANLALLAPAHPAGTGVGAPAAREGIGVARPFTVARVVLGVALLVLLGQAIVWSTGVVAWGRAQAAMAGGGWAEADAQLALAASLDPGFALYARELGKLRAALGDMKAGRRLIERAVRTNPADPNGHRAIGVLALVVGDHDAAIEPLRRAAELDATRLESFLLVGVAFDRAGLPEEADDAYATAIAQAPALLLSDGWAAIGMDADRLMRLVEPALERSASGQAATHLATRRAELLLIIGDRDGLERLLETGSVPAPDSWRAVAEAEAGDLPAALRLLERSRADGRRAVEYWTNAAFAQTLAGRQGDAERSHRLARMLRETAPPPTSIPRLLPPIEHDANDFWMYGRTTSVLSWDAGLPLPSPHRGAWLRLHDPGAIEVPQLRQLRHPAAPAPAGARP
jgi:O-antigen ligase